jgi:hypothetical protein
MKPQLKINENLLKCNDAQIELNDLYLRMIRRNSTRVFILSAACFIEMGLIIWCLVELLRR